MRISDIPHKPFACGTRVQIPVYFDLWARGARFGTVAGYRAGRPGYSDTMLVRMDHPSVRNCARIPRLDWDYVRDADNGRDWR